MIHEKILQIAADSGIDCDADGDIWGSQNGALIAFAATIYQLGVADGMQAARDGEHKTEVFSKA